MDIFSKQFDMKTINNCCLVFVLLSMGACNNSAGDKKGDAKAPLPKGSYGYDVAFLKEHAPNLVELQEGDRKVLVSAAYQGRVMTSTATGDSGNSYGWINYGLIASGEKKKQFNPAGGEERFWLGPEGGQYSIYFNKGDSFTIAHWQVPPVVDTETYNIAQQSASSVTFTKSAVLTNYSGTTFNLDIKRTITLPGKDAVEKSLQTAILPGVQFVAYESDNRITNTGKEAWKSSTGLLSIWLLGMMNPTPQTKVMIPFVPGADAASHITCLLYTSD